MKEIRQIIQSYDRLDHSAVKCALAQVVHVAGSSYRRIGARMLVTDTGTWIGGISGGCLEGDALKRAKKAIIQNGVSSVVYDTTKDDEFQIGVGLGCNGLIETLFIPVDADDPGNPIEQLRQLLQSRDRTVLITAIDTESTFFSPGTTVSMEEIHHLQKTYPEIGTEVSRLLTSGRSRVLELKDKLSNPARILIEIIPPRLRCIVVGDNYDIYPMLEIGNLMDWEMHLVARQRKLKAHDCLKNVQIHAKESADKISVDAATAIVIMNHDYAEDKKFLSRYWSKEVTYLGLLGPKIRGRRMVDELEVEGRLHNFEDNPSFFSPAGMDLGSEGPEEIALSIVAEIVARCKGREGGFLKRRSSTIHDRL